MKKIQAHILKIKKWNQEWENIEEEKTKLKNKIDDLNESVENAVEINSEETWNENTQQITSDNLKPPNF